MKTHPDLDDTLSRLLRTVLPAELGFDEERILSNMMGLLVGGLLVSNPYHQTPDELLTGTTQRRDGANEAEIEEAASWYLDATIGST